MEKENGFFDESTGEEIPAAVEEVKERSVTPPQETKTQDKKGKKRKILHIILAVLIAVGCFVGGFFTYRLTLDEEMRLLIKVKDTIQDEYYEDVTDEAFYDAVFESVNAAVKQGDCKTDEAFYDAVYAGINNNLLDTYSQYMSAEEYASVRVQSTGTQSGIGVYFLVGTNDLAVTRVAGNSPAEEIGLKKGDTITAIGKTKNSLIECKTRGDFSNFMVDVTLGEKFCLQWRTAEGEVRSSELRKKVYVENYVYYKTNTVSYGFDGGLLHEPKSVGEPLTYLDDETAYIQITQFNGSAGSVFDGAMALFKLENKKNLIVDLRGNGGGYMDIMQSIAKYFCKDTAEKFPIAAIADYGERRENFVATGNVYGYYFTDDSRITVLANNMTASASECLIGCMYGYNAIGYDDICLVEESNGVAKTYGKGIMQTTFQMGDGSALKLTTAKIFWPTDTDYSIHGVGVTKADGTKTVSSSLTYDEQTRAAIENLYA